MALWLVSYLDSDGIYYFLIYLKRRGDTLKQYRSTTLVYIVVNQSIRYIGLLKVGVPVRLATCMIKFTSI